MHRGTISWSACGSVREIPCEHITSVAIVSCTPDKVLDIRLKEGGPLLYTQPRATPVDLSLEQIAALIEHYAPGVQISTVTLPTTVTLESYLAKAYDKSTANTTSNSNTSQIAKKELSDVLDVLIQREKDIESRNLKDRTKESSALMTRLVKYYQMYQPCLLNTPNMHMLSSLFEDEPDKLMSLLADVYGPEPQSIEPRNCTSVYSMNEYPNKHEDYIQFHSNHNFESFVPLDTMYTMSNSHNKDHNSKNNKDHSENDCLFSLSIQSNQSSNISSVTTFSSSLSLSPLSIFKDKTNYSSKSLISSAVLIQTPVKKKPGSFLDFEKEADINCHNKPIVNEVNSRPNSICVSLHNTMLYRLVVHDVHLSIEAPGHFYNILKQNSISAQTDPIISTNILKAYCFPCNDVIDPGSIHTVDLTPSLLFQSLKEAYDLNLFHQVNISSRNQRKAWKTASLAQFLNMYVYDYL